MYIISSHRPFNNNARCKLLACEAAALCREFSANFSLISHFNSSSNTSHTFCTFPTKIFRFYYKSRRKRRGRRKSNNFLNIHDDDDARVVRELEWRQMCRPLRLKYDNKQQDSLALARVVYVVAAVFDKITNSSVNKKQT